MTTAVECKLIREGGTYAEAGGIEYHFAPQPDGAHVAFIEDADHADIFLGITEGYRLYRGAAKVEAPAVKVEQPEAPKVEKLDEASDVRAELAKEFERLYGEAPHPRTGIEKLRKLIAEKQTV